MLSIVRSVSNEIEEICACTRFLSDFQNSSILCFTETWLKPDIPDNLIDRAGFDTVRHDRSSSVKDIKRKEEV